MKIKHYFIGALAMLLMMSTAQAVTIYQYSGNNYDTIIDNNDPPSGTFTTSMSVTGSFTVNAPLGTMGWTDISASVLSYSFYTDRGSFLTESNSNINDFFVAVDGAGSITNWNINLVEPFGIFAGDQMSAVKTANPTISIGGTVEDVGQLIECTLDTTCFPSRDRASITDLPGSWTVNAVPIPAAAWLFSSGLLGLLGISRRK